MSSPAKPKKRDLILDTALALFNEQGSHKVTTNHIASAMGISPGNLYYHFKNKEHIIRELLARLIAGFDALVQLDDRATSGLDLMVRTIQATTDLLFDYRFIYIELAALLARDDEFKVTYNAIKTRRAAEFVFLFEMLAPLGVFRRVITPEERDALIFIGWTYAEGIITALSTSNIPVTREAVHTHFKRFVFLLKAYLQPAVWAELAQKMEI